MTIDCDELHRLYAVEKLSLMKIARRMQLSEGSVGRKIKQLRKREGVERWPLRTPATQPAAPPAPTRLRPGEPSLPPLPSLVDR